MAKKSGIIRVKPDTQERMEDKEEARAEAQGRKDKESHDEYINFLMTLDDQSKVHQLLQVFQNFSGKIKAVLLEPKLNGDIDELMKQVKIMIASSFENPKKLKSYIVDLKLSVDKKSIEFPSEIKRRGKHKKKRVR